MTEDEVFDDDHAPLFDSNELWDDLEFVIDEWDIEDDGAGAPDAVLSASNPTLSDPVPEGDPAAAGPVDPIFGEPTFEEPDFGESGLGDLDFDEPGFEDLGVVDQDEHDMLFGDVTEDLSENVLGESRTFSEESGIEWAGAETELSDLGMDMVDDSEVVPVHMASDDEDSMFDIHDGEDLILIDSEGDLEADAELEIAGASQGGAGDLAAAHGQAVDAGFEEFTEMEAGMGHAAVADVQDPGIDYNTRDFAVSEEDEDSEWSPVSEFDEDEEEEVYAEDQEFDEEEDPDYSEYEEAYYEDSNDFAEYAEKRRSPLRWVAGIAAALLISAAGAFWYLKTENFTPSTDVDVVDLVKVPRPTTDVKVGTPTKTPKKDPVPPKKDPVATTPKKDPVTPTKDPVPPKKDPTPKKDPVATTPKKDPVGTTPKKDPVATTPKKDPKRIDEPRRPEDMLNIGGEEGTAISSKQEGLMERHARSVVKSVNGLVMGSQALAQLSNENIFVGRVKKLSDASVTLRMSEGEITLQRADLRALTTLADAEYEEWKEIVATGMIKLRNDNRLKGKIVEARDDAVILMVNSNRVIIPKSAIDSVTANTRQGVNLSTKEEVESDDWFRQLVEEQIESSDAKKAKLASPGK